MPRSLLGLVLAAVFSAEFAFGQIEQAKPWLGVAIDPGKTGVLVKEVIPGTPAEQYGLRAGDEITAINDVAVKQPEELIRAVQGQGVGNTVVVHLVRGGKREQKQVQLVARPDQLELVRKQLVGKPLPAFDLEVVHGKEPGSSDKLKGRVTIIEFWATWCPACRATHARLSALAKAKPEIAIVGISDEDAAEQKRYADKAKVSFTLLRDASQKVQAQWMVSAIPMLAVVDKKGEVAFATIGAGSYLEEAIATAEKLAKP